MNYYTYRVMWSEEDQEFVALCAEFPSLSFLANTQPKALKGLVKTVDDILADMEATGETPPETLSGKSYSGKFMVRVPPRLHRDLSIQAAESGVSLNRLVSSKLAVA